MPSIAGHPAEAYAASVLDRFSSPGVADQISRICADGSVKFATFVMPTLARQIELGGPVRAGATALAAWARYLTVVPLPDQAADAYGAEARVVATQALGDPLRFLELERVIPPLVARDPGFRSDFAAAAAALGERGPLAAAAAAATATTATTAT
jgi:mannitol 2-dehydrogenase